MVTTSYIILGINFWGKARGMITTVSKKRAWQVALTPKELQRDVPEGKSSNRAVVLGLPDFGGKTTRTDFGPAETPFMRLLCLNVLIVVFIRVR
jgi:hypothetical protein